MQTLVLATGWAKSGKPLCRRSFMLSLAVSAPAVLMLSPAHGQGDVWQEYSRTDLGFRVAMPGAARVETNEDGRVRSIDSQLEHKQIILGVTWQEWMNVVSDERLFAAFRDGMRLAMPVTEEAPLVMNGFPAREFTRKSDGLNYVYRYIVMGNQTLAVSAFGGRALHASATVRRFFDSFTLLRSER